MHFKTKKYWPNKRFGNYSGGKKKWTSRNNGRYNQYEKPTRQPISVFDENQRQKLYMNDRVGFVSTVLKSFNPKKNDPDDIVNEARRYFQYRYDRDRRNKVERPSHWLNSASSALSELKRKMASGAMATYPYRKKLCISKRELALLDKYNHSRLENKTHHLKEINLTHLVNKLYELLLSDDAAELSLAIAGLTGRRQTEVLFSANFAPVSIPIYHRYPSFWSYVTGFSKIRKQDRYAVRARDLPLLAPQKAIAAAVADLRSMWPSDSHRQASYLYAHRLTKAVKIHLKPLGIMRMHDLRKTFAQIAFKFFNERDSVLPAFASKVLGHKKALGRRIMTYLLIRTSSPPDIDLIFQLARRSDLHSSMPEHHELL